ncbi:MAG: DUF5723 family protein [Saprospiraceae bacterium]
MLKYSILLVFISLGLLPAMAQQELSTPFFRELWQANRTNPALFPDQKYVLGLPGIYNNLLVTNITYNDLVTEREGQKVINVNQAIDLLEANNLIRENLDIETISFGVKLGKLHLNLGHALKYNGFLAYPKTLPQLVWQGNAQFIGQTVPFGPDLHFLGYHEFSAGAAYQLLPFLTVGGKVKYLSGIGDISTPNTDLRLTTSDDIYQLKLNADYVVNSSGTLQYDGYDDLAFNFQFGNFESDQMFSTNTGLAFDLGAHLTFGKLDFSISVLDIGGRIDWKEDVRNYSLQGEYEYQGLDVAQGILDNQSELGNAIDSLKDVYQPIETSREYSTDIPLRSYLSVGYQMSDQIRLGALFYTENYRGETYGALALNGQLELNKLLTLGVTYAYRQERFDNFGLQAIATLGPVQVYAATDNILTVVNPADSHSSNFRVGLNLLFGKAAPILDSAERAFY